MIEKQLINNKEIWLQVEPWHVHRDNPHIIPTEYFTVAWYFHQPEESIENGEMIKEENGAPKLFESPVAAIGYAVKLLQQNLPL